MYLHAAARAIYSVVRLKDEGMSIEPLSSNRVTVTVASRLGQEPGLTVPT